jgi:hypothetical protein
MYRSTVAVAPEAFLAVTVCLIDPAVVPVGVPAMTPVDGASVRPAGRAGDTEKSFAPPDTVGGFCVMATPFQWTAGLED